MARYLTTGIGDVRSTSREVHSSTPAITFIMLRVHGLLAACFCLVLITGCASYRDRTLDYRLPPFESPALEFAGLKSVQTREGQDPETAFVVAISGGPAVTTASDNTN